MLRSGIVFGFFLTAWSIFANGFVVSRDQNHFTSSLTRTKSSLSMVRNIDLPECLVFYGIPASFFSPDDTDLISLLQECADTDTAVIVIPEPIAADSSDTYSLDSDNLPVKLILHEPQSYAPNPKDLYEALNSITVQPRPFGGSSGFGAKQYADPERFPLPARTVVFCQTAEQTLASKYCGTRVLCFQDNDLADAVIDRIDFYLDEIATPGSFWLNPPNPMDEKGNKVDIHELIESYSLESNGEAQAATETAVAPEDEMSEEEMQRILADLDSL